MFLPFNGGQRPLLMFDGIANAAEPRAFIKLRSTKIDSSEAGASDEQKIKFFKA